MSEDKQTTAKAVLFKFWFVMNLNELDVNIKVCQFLTGTLCWLSALRPRDWDPAGWCWRVSLTLP